MLKNSHEIHTTAIGGTQRPSGFNTLPATTKRKKVATALFGLTATLAAACTTASQNPNTYTPPSQSVSASGTYYNAGGFQYATGTGATVTLSQEQPSLKGHANQSLAELLVESADKRQVIEVGWQVNPGLTDARSRLFVTHSVNGTSECYNGCGFVQTNGSVALDSAVPVGQVGEFSIQEKPANGEWDIFYNNYKLGHFPNSLWKGGFTKFNIVEAIGEVNSSESAVPCADMGSGKLGTSPGAAVIRDFRLTNADVRPALTPFYAVTKSGSSTFPPLNSSEPYNAQWLSADHTSLSYGGPGNCPQRQ